ncbi:fimbrial associated sortase [Corynebacterium suranareeae]|uniref:Fimbrial associated sortase n=1 Tax=Corynebacterium suranareeae TaxID=2506452 RepID=A0A160PSK5_9CORY|nr:class C sortase [Corynebacterium suranareeae]BAU97267.1 fimbrial associated sortase [Corynebacterium suranareeae]
MSKHQKVAKAGSAGRGSRITSLVLLIVSLALLSYPVVATVLADYNNSENARRYAEEITESATPETIQQLRSKAEDYNADLWATGHPVRQENPEDPAYQGYKEQLLTSDRSTTMARIQIPDVGIDLPIYHGTTDDVLYRGAGHMYNSDLPIGGESSTSVITAHTGMVNASMFDNLGKLKEGEPVYINVLGETLRYRMTGYEVVKPEDYDAVTYEDGVDKLILITCTPYGINSDRLLVTAERDHSPIEEGEVPDGWRLQLSWWMKLDLAIIATIIAIALWSTIRRRKNLKVEISG